MDLKSFAAVVMKHVREYVQPAIDELAQRIDAIPAGKDGRDGIDGKDGSAGRDGIDGKDGAPGENGRDGVDGRDGSPGERGADGKDGRDGVDGKDGQPGANGRDGVDGKDGAPGADGKDGRDGIDGKAGAPGLNGKDGVDGIAGKDGEPGRNGIDGKSVTVDDVLPHFEQAFTKWALDFERRAQDIHTRLLASFDKPKDGIDGTNGKDGSDGLGFDDMRVEHDGERAFTLIFERGEQRKEFTFQLPVVLERGVYKAGQDYERGDGVTADGSYWIAQKAKPSGRPGQSPDWRLSVKRGRDGKGA